MSDRDCVHGRLARQCEVCALIAAEAIIAAVDGALADCGDIPQPTTPEEYRQTILGLRDVAAKAVLRDVEQRIARLRAFADAIRALEAEP